VPRLKGLNSRVPPGPLNFKGLLTLSGVAVEKGTKAVISVTFSTYDQRTFNNLRTNVAVEIPRKEFFNSHGIYRQS
jgi:hypothetical protein